MKPNFKVLIENHKNLLRSKVKLKGQTSDEVMKQLNEAWPGLIDLMREVHESKTFVPDMITSASSAASLLIAAKQLKASGKPYNEENLMNLSGQEIDKLTALVSGPERERFIGALTEAINIGIQTGYMFALESSKEDDFKEFMTKLGWQDGNEKVN